MTIFIYYLKRKNYKLNKNFLDYESSKRGEKEVSEGERRRGNKAEKEREEEVI